MSEDAVELVRDGFEAFVSGDVERALAVFDPEVVVRIHDLPDAPEYRGLAGLAKWQADWEQNWESWRWEPEQFLETGGRVLAVLRVVAKGRSSGVETRRVTAALVLVRAGRVVELDYYASKADALEAAVP
jgi:ketosteroid isomerase-like protein